jgi:adenine-specific DNA-methyltransferase
MPTLDWLNRAEALTVAGKVPYRVLQPVAGYGDAGADNLLIQGDNLDALKALLPFYRGRVKCIFIDPPYNTKSAFEHYDDNLEHSQWLSMMQPRLVLLRELLAEDGSIWVTIDDNEGHYLKVLMDEVFGRGNFVANVVWQKKYTIANDAKWLSDNHDHVLVYANEKSTWRPNKIPRTDEMNARYKNPDNHLKGQWKSTPLHAKSGSEAAKGFFYKFKNGVLWKPPVGTFPRFSEESLRAMDANDEIWFGKDGTATPSRKTFLCDLLNEGTPSATVWLHTDAGNNHEARDEVKNFNSWHPFDTPKPEKLLQRIIHLATQEGDLVLDSFLGSGTTAAVAHKMGRRWIGIEMGSHAETHCLPRLQKVIAGEQGGISEAVNWQGGGGFRFMRLGEPMFEPDGGINPAVRFDTLAGFVWMQETGLAASGPWPVPLLGVHDGRAIYLLFNGILGDRRPKSGNVLTQEVLTGINRLCPHSGPKLIYGEACRLGEKRLAAENITFKHIPYDVRAR